MMPPVDPFLETKPSTASDSSTGWSWMVIFTDLISLMLTFFVLLFSMSNLQIDRWEHLIDVLSRTLSPSEERVEHVVSTRYNVGTFSRERAINLDYLASVLEESASQNAILARADLIRREDRLLIVFPGDILFPTDGAVLSGPARQALFVLGGVLRNVGNRIGVNGHADPRRLVGGGSFDSNWELSLARAVAVANLLKRVGYQKEISAYGYADSRYAELPDLPRAARMSLARRVDIVVFPTVEE
jgi:chemotaxis protein MotB